MSGGSPVWLIATRGLRQVARRPALLAEPVLFPVVLLVMMLVMFGELVSGYEGTAYIDRLGPGMVLFGAAYGCAGTAAVVNTDLRNGLYQRLRITPLPRSAPWLGLLVGELLRVAAVVVVLTGSCVVLGLRFVDGPATVVSFLGLSVLFALPFLCLALVVGARARSVEVATSSLNTPLTLLLLGSTVLVPESAFPAVLQGVAAHNPLSVANDALVGLATGTGSAGAVLQSGLWVLALLAVTLPWAAREAQRLGSVAPSSTSSRSSKRSSPSG